MPLFLTSPHSTLPHSHPSYLNSSSPSVFIPHHLFLIISLTSSSHLPPVSVSFSPISYYLPRSHCAAVIHVPLFSLFKTPVFQRQASETFQLTVRKVYQVGWSLVWLLFLPCPCSPSVFYYTNKTHSLRNSLSL